MSRCGDVKLEGRTSEGQVFPHIETLSFPSPPAGVRMLDGDVTDVVEARSLSFRPQYIDIYLASWGPEDDGAKLEGPGPLTLLALQKGIKTVRKGLCIKGEEKGLLLVCLSPLSIPSLNLRAGVGGAPFSSGHQGMGGEEATTAPVTATAAVSTLSLSAAALGVEACLITWSSAPPYLRQRTPVGKQRNW